MTLRTLLTIAALALACSLGYQNCSGSSSSSPAANPAVTSAAVSTTPTGYAGLYNVSKWTCGTLDLLQLYQSSGSPVNLQFSLNGSTGAELANSRYNSCVTSYALNLSYQDASSVAVNVGTSSCSGACVVGQCIPNSPASQSTLVYSVQTANGIMTLNHVLTAADVSDPTLAYAAARCAPNVNVELDLVPALTLAGPQEVEIGKPAQFTASGGAPPYIYSIIAGSGSINASTGAFLAATTAGTVAIAVKDASSLPAPFISFMVVNEQASADTWYRNVLGRNASQTELNAWRASVAGGATSAQLGAALVQTTEAQNRLAASLTTAFGRAALATELTTYSALLKNGAALSAVMVSVESSTTYVGIHGRTGAIVASDYFEVVGATATGSQLSPAEAALQNGSITTAAYRSQLADSTAAAEAITALYQQLYGFAPTAQQLASQQAYLSGSGTLLAMRESLLGQAPCMGAPQCSGGQ